MDAADTKAGDAFFEKITALGTRTRAHARAVQRDFVHRQPVCRNALERWRNARLHLEQLADSLSAIDAQSRFVPAGSRGRGRYAGRDRGAGAAAVERMKTEFWKYQEACGIESKILITDEDTNILYTSFGESLLSSYLVNYNNAICYKVRQTAQTEAYRAVYYERGNYSDTMYVQPFYQDGTLEGFVTVFLSGSAWNFHLSESNFDGIITDEARQTPCTSASPACSAGATNTGAWSTAVAHGKRQPLLGDVPPAAGASGHGLLSGLLSAEPRDLDRFFAV